MGAQCNSARRVAMLVVCAVVAVLVLSACSTQFVYNRLDWLTHYYLTSQVSLDGAQSRELRTNLQSFFAWHRRSELPRYASFLDHWADGAAESLDVGDFDAGRVQVEGFMRDSIAHGAPNAARWLRGLRPQQVDELFASLADDERKAREKSCHQDPAERRAETLKRFIENVETWTGKLRRSQRELIAARLAEQEGDACEDVSVQERTRLQFRELVDRHRQAPDFAERLAVFLTRPEDRMEPRYRAKFEANRARFVRLLAEIDHSLSAEQRTRAVTRLRGVAHDLKKLSAETRTT